jgi:hypothetical protein
MNPITLNQMDEKLATMSEPERSAFRNGVRWREGQQVVDAGWLDITKTKPEPGQRIEGMSPSNCWFETFNPTEPLGLMTHWRPRNLTEDGNEEAPVTVQQWGEEVKRCHDRMVAAFQRTVAEGSLYEFDSFDAGYTAGMSDATGAEQ